MYILYNMTIFSVDPIEKYNRGMGGNSNFARPMLPIYRGCTVFNYIWCETSECSYISYHSNEGWNFQS